MPLTVGNTVISFRNGERGEKGVVYLSESTGYVLVDLTNLPLTMDRYFLGRMNPMPSAEVVLQQVRRMLQEMVEQMLTIAERLCTVAQQIAPTHRAQPPPPGNGFFASYTPRETFPRSQRQPPSATGFPDYVQSVENALRGEYRRAERAEKELADLRARYTAEGNTGSHRRGQPPASGFRTGRHRSAKRPRQEQGWENAPPHKGKAKEVVCAICDGPHTAPQCKWMEGHCFKCGRPGHRRFDCPSGRTAATPAPRIQDESDQKFVHKNQENSQIRERQFQEDPISEDTSEEDPSEEKPSEIRPAKPDSPADAVDDTNTRSTENRHYDTPEDDDSPGPRVRRRFAVRRWPPGCGRGLHFDPIEDALSREG